MAGIDPRLYGGAPLEPELRQEFGGPIIRQSPQAPAAVMGQNTGALLQGQRAVQEANREQAGFWAAMGGAMHTGLTADLIQAFRKDDYPSDPSFKPGDRFDHVDIALSDDEFQWMREAKSEKEWNWKLNRLRDVRDAMRAAGDNWAGGFLGMAVDPAYVGLDLVSGMAGSVARIGRLRTAAVGVGLGAGAMQVAEESRPISGLEHVMGALATGVGAAMVYRNGRAVPRDSAYPEAELTEVIQSAITNGERRVIREAEYVEEVIPAHTETREVSTGVFEEVQVPERTERKLVREAEYAPVSDPTDVAEAAAHAEARQASLAARIGEKVQWSLHKSLSSFGPVGRKVADLLVDNNADLSINAVESIQRAERAALHNLQAQYEELLQSAMRDSGVGLLQRINPFTARSARSTQRNFEKELHLEMLRREQAQRLGQDIASDGVDKRIKAMADKLDELHRTALKQLKAAGVEGAEDILERSGWMHRKWSLNGIEESMKRLGAAGLSDKAAKSKIIGLVSSGLRRANGWEKELADDVAGAIVNRTIRKGYFEDAAFNSQQSAGTLANLRDILTEEGLSGPRLERALSVLQGVNAEAGKAGFLKRRMDLDYRSAIPDGQGGLIRLADLFDSNTTGIVDRYIDGVTSSAAFARKGLRKSTDIDDLRKEFLASVGPERRDAARDLFDNTVARLQGRPVGQKVHEAVRVSQSIGRSIALGMSAIWQVTEYATPMAKYGFIATTKHALKEMPVFRKLWGEVATDPATSTRIRDILARQPEQDLRIRPYLDRFEDNFELPQNSKFLMALQQAEHLVPYANMMKFVHSHQGRMVANLITDRLVQAAKGNTKVRDMLRKYGIESQVMDRLAAEIRKHGDDTAKWSDGMLAEVQPALSKMMDESVLHGRMGDMPAFAQFDNVGKFIFTYRSFVLNAHNKLLSGGLQRDGALATALLMTYQFPLAMLAVRAANTLKGKEESDMQELAWQSIGQMGAVGLFGELLAVMRGQKNQWGAPGLIPLDRAYKIIGSASRGDLGGALEATGTAVPLISISPAVRALQNLSPEN